MTTIKTDSLKDIKDYLHLYLGSWINVYNDVTNEYSIDRKMTPSDLNLILNYNKKVNLHLRPLSDMTDIEAEELATIHHYDIPDDPGVKEELINIYSNEGELHLGTHYLPVRMYLFGLLWLLKQGFDVFGLIESGLAIEKAK